MSQAGIYSFLRTRWLWLILLFAFALRTYHFACPPWDYHNWRQTLTLMVARDLARHGFHVFHPQVMWVTSIRPSDPSYFKAEFSIQSILAAFLYKLFGESDTLARIVVIAFSLLGIYFLYDLLNRRAGLLAACLGAFVYSLLPYHLFFGRVFMPDVPALSLALGGLDALDRWSSDRKWRWLLAAAVLTALAILQKLTVAFVALPLLYLFWLAHRGRLLLRPEPYTFGIIAALPPLAWYGLGIWTAQGGFSIAQPVHIFGRHLAQWTEFSFVRQILKALSAEAFSPLGLVLAAAGLFWPLRCRAAWLFRLWVVGAGLLLFLIPDNLPENHYYLSLLLPGGAALAGLALADWTRQRRSYLSLATILVLFTVGAIHSALPFYLHDRWPRDLGTLISRLTAPEDLIVTESGGSPNLLYFADRRGWMLNRNYDPAILERLSQLGARYYAAAFIVDSEKQREFFRLLDARFKRLTAVDAAWPWPIYDLAASPGPLRDVQLGEIQHSYSVNFGNRIELRGASLREVLDWPASYEVTTYWRYLKESATDLRIFMSVTDSTGRIAYQQDQWRKDGPFPASKAGNILRERYLLVLPESLPGGKYQIQVGWFDSAEGHRLPILSPALSSQGDSTEVEEIHVRRPPRFDWFRVD